MDCNVTDVSCALSAHRCLRLYIYIRYIHCLQKFRLVGAWLQLQRNRVNGNFREIISFTLRLTSIIFFVGIIISKAKILY